MAFIESHVAERHPDADGQGLRWGSGAICFQLTELGRADRPRDLLRAPRPQALHAGAAELGAQAVCPLITRVHEGNHSVYGTWKVWLTLNRERAAGAPPIARCTVERLMADLGPVGAVRGKVKRTMIRAPRAPQPLDLVDRNFRPLAPDWLWVADFKYVSTW